MKKIFFGAFLSVLLHTAQAVACACSDSLTTIATSSLLPNKKGGIVFLQYDTISQNANLHGSSTADSANNHHKKIDTQIVTFGGQYMLNRDFGLSIRTPYINRTSDIMGADSHANGDHAHITESAQTSKEKALGDARIMAIYSGFFDDMSLGLVFGAKLPTGTTKNADLHAEMQAGSGSYDAIFGAYYKTQIARKVEVFSQIIAQKPLITKHNYNVGSEFNAVIGSSYNLGKIAFLENISPILQFIGTKKDRDSGLISDTANTGYKRVFIAPAIEINIGRIKVYGDIELPIYEYVNGNQLSVGKVIKIITSYNF